MEENINDFGGRLRKFAESNYKTMTDFTKQLGIARQYITPYLNNTSKPGADILQKLSNLGCNINWLLTGEGSMKLNDAYSNSDDIARITDGSDGIPYYDIDVTGSIVESFNDIKEEPAFYIDFKPFNDCIAYFTLYGDSMSPMFNSGDILGIKNISNYDVLLFGEAYLVITNANANNLRTVKLIHKSNDPSKLILRSVNQQYGGDMEVRKNDIINMYIVKGKITRLML
mgnify:CR=1 FL=1